MREALLPAAQTLRVSCAGEREAVTAAALPPRLQPAAAPPTALLPAAAEAAAQPIL